jgi:hypothetical protein
MGTERSPLYDSRAGTEADLLRALLTGSSSLRIVWWNDYMARVHGDEAKAGMAALGSAPGRAIYLESMG